MAQPPGVDSRYRNFVWNSARWDGFQLRDDDIVISTPPKCGTTWMQMQVALLLFRTPDLPAPLAALSPWLEMNTRPLDEVVADLDAQTHRRFIKTHTALGGIPWHDTVTYLCVVRDPRDAALSWDNHMSNMDFDRFVAARAAAVGLDDLAELGMDAPPPPPPPDPVERFWTWVEGTGEPGAVAHLDRLVHLADSFWTVRDRPNVHLFHYADMRADPAGQMTRLAGILGVDPPTPELVEAASFEHMRSRSDALVPNSDTDFWQSRQQFFDKARSGEWRDVVPESQLPRYEAALRASTQDDELIAWLHDGGHG